MVPQHHLDQIHRVGVRHAEAVDELGRLAEAAQERVDLREIPALQDRGKVLAESMMPMLC